MIPFGHHPKELESVGREGCENLQFHLRSGAIDSK